MATSLVHLSDQNFQSSVGKGVVLVDCHATWCGPCRMIAPIIEKLAESLAGKIAVGKLDIDEAPITADTLQITSVPTLILFKDGQEKKRMVGVKDYDTLLKWIETV